MGEEKTSQAGGAPSAVDLPEEARCQKCGYSLHGLRSQQCPECGRSFDAHMPETFHARDPAPAAARRIGYMAIALSIFAVHVSVPSMPLQTRLPADGAWRTIGTSCLLIAAGVTLALFALARSRGRHWAAWIALLILVVPAVMQAKIVYLAIRFLGLPGRT